MSTAAGTKRRNKNQDSSIYPLLNQFINEKVPSFDALPEEWKNVDLKAFSDDTQLWDFQVKALEYAIRAMYYYYSVLDENKQRFWDELQEYASDLDLAAVMNIKSSDADVWNILRRHFYTQNDTIPYSNFVNRMGFWMATGSGKTLVIVKLIDILMTFMERGLIPKKEILFLTYRDDLVDQFTDHFEKFNKSQSKNIIRLYELKDYNKVKYNNVMFERPIFYYRSNIISDTESTKFINYRNYDNNGDWYVILDEAHKGDKESSKSQQYFSILARNGFLFNFSATFTDVRDILTTVFEFNLSTFIREGYGKEIKIFEENFQLNSKYTDFSNDEKKVIILKSLIMQAYLKKRMKIIRNNGILKKEGILYHSPLSVYLVNSVNTEDSDLKLLFSLLKDISSTKGYEELNQSGLFQKALDSFSEPKDPFDNSNQAFDYAAIKGITPTEVLREVFNSDTPGDIELIKLKTGEEFALKLMTSEKPFALIKVSKADELLNELVKTHGLRVQENYENKAYFSSLNDDEDFNILLGSRAFYEGWDSNRPNIIAFVNIGTGEDAKKFVLQSIGRGLRIQPRKNGDRKRIGETHKFLKYRSDIVPLETLYVWGTKKDILAKIVEGVKTVIENSGKRIEVRKNTERINGHKLFIPICTKKKVGLESLSVPSKYIINPIDYQDVKSVIKNLSDQMLYILYLPDSEQPTKIIDFLRIMFEEKNQDRFFQLGYARKRVGWDQSIKNIIEFIQNNVEYEYFVQVDENDDEYIVHYRNIVVRLPDDKISKVKEDIKKVYDRKEEVSVSITGRDSDDIDLDYIAEHYYIPLIESRNRDATRGKVANILTEKSELDFVSRLERSSQGFNVDWWLFSRIVDSVDKIFIPYVDNDSIERKFYPDFIFWFKKGNNYLITFVDPKGTEHSLAERKIDGYEKLFVENGRPKMFEFEEYQIIVQLLLYNEEGYSSEKYKHYWISSMREFAERVNQAFTIFDSRDYND